MLSLLAALLLAQVAPPEPVPPRQDPPKPVTPPPVTEPAKPQDPKPVPDPVKTPTAVRDHGIDLVTLTDLVRKATKKDFLVDASIFHGRINMTPPATISPDEFFAFYASALATCGYALLKDPSAANRYQVVVLGLALPVAPPEYTDASKLPDTEELCTLTIKLTALSADMGYLAVRQRLHPKLQNSATHSGDVVSFIDFAPTLKQIARLLADADATAAKTLLPIEVELWIVDLRDSTIKQDAPAAEFKDLLPLIQAKAVLKETTKVSMAGIGSARLTPSSPDGFTKASITLTQGSVVAEFKARNDRGMVKLHEVAVTASSKATGEFSQSKLYSTDLVTLKPGDITLLGSWGTPQGTQYLVARATVK